MAEVKPIGGYFGLELSRGEGFIHNSGIFVASGRNAEELILRNLLPISKLWIPYFTCEVVLEPLRKLGIAYTFYHITKDLEIAQDIQLEKGEYILYTNYFGIKDGYVSRLAEKYQHHLIIDNAQALYSKPINKINTIYSPRKFVGIPDGGIAYCTPEHDVWIDETDISYGRCSHLLKRLDIGPTDGYSDFRLNAEKLENLPLRRMSNLTRRIMLAINYNDIKNRRRANFEYLHNQLKGINQLSIPPIESFECPLTYPFLIEHNALKPHLISNKVYVATYWPNVLEWCDKKDIEYNLAQNIVHLPIDQRYGLRDMKRILQLISNYGNCNTTFSGT